VSGDFLSGKRQREAGKERKKTRRDARRRRKRRLGPGTVPIGTVQDVTGDLDAVERRLLEQQSRPRGAQTIASRIFVGSLSWGTSADDLRRAFSGYGAVAEAVVINDRDTGKSRGFGFVVMEDRRDAARAVEALNGSEIDGRAIVVNLATERRR
jgi:RNA recognition motif-containing protein